MKYAVQQCVNGNYSIVAEFPNDNIRGALVKFHQVCANLWNSEDVLKANVKIVNESLNVVMNKTEDIDHPAPEVEVPAEE